VKIVSPETTYIDMSVAVESGAVLGPNVTLRGNTLVRAGAFVEGNSVLIDTTLESHAELKAFSHCEGAVLRGGATAGPFARLRPGAELGPEVHIGNFVEVKKSRLAARSKANHLAYIGDAEIGERVNVGAGTIVCNYDGANKYKTIIEDDVFIGSDTQLVAPVTVGRGATLGAGTTLTRDAPPDALTISRARQTTVPGWVRPKKAQT
jgi:bifunctional UDP-N-acetylglucosamine pyrophosphorylase/glucosamine-1-phosphate N-acetyltransferase